MLSILANRRKWFEDVAASGRLTSSLANCSLRLGVQNFGGFFTEFGSPGPRVRGEKPAQILNSKSGAGN